MGWWLDYQRGLRAEQEENGVAQSAPTREGVIRGQVQGWVSPDWSLGGRAELWLP